MDEDVETIEKILAAYEAFGAKYAAKIFHCDPSVIRDIVRRNPTFFND